MRIEFLDKAEADSVLPTLYRILYANMSKIALFGKSYEEAYSQWFSCVRPALDKEPRQILLLRDGEEIIGFFQYYVSGGVFMMEEIQFAENYRGTGLFGELYRFLVKIIPADTGFVEAYAHPKNEKSIAILSHLALSPVKESGDENLLHFRGEYRKLTEKYGTDEILNERDQYNERI